MITKQAFYTATKKYGGLPIQDEFWEMLKVGAMTKPIKRLETAQNSQDFVWYVVDRVWEEFACQFDERDPRTTFLLISRVINALVQRHFRIVYSFASKYDIESPHDGKEGK